MLISILFFIWNSHRNEQSETRMRGHLSVISGCLFPGNEPGAENRQAAVLVRLSILFCYVLGTPIEMNRESRACASTYPFSVVGSFPSPGPGLGTWEYPFKKSENLTVWQITEKNLFEWSRWLSPSFLENTGGTDGSILMSGSWMQDPCGSDEVNLDHSIADGYKTDIKILQPPDASLNTLDFFIFGDALSRLLLPVDPS